SFWSPALYRKESDNVCDTNDERNLSSGPTDRTAYIMWVKNKSCDVRTKDQHATTRTGDAVRSGDLQALQENSSAGFKRGLKKPSTDYAEYLCNLWMVWEEVLPSLRFRDYRRHPRRPELPQALRSVHVAASRYRGRR